MAIAHGRDHEERQQKARPPRTNNTPKGDPETQLETELAHSKRGGAVPPQGVVGRHLERPGYSETEYDPPAPEGLPQGAAQPPPKRN